MTIRYLPQKVVKKDENLPRRRVSLYRLASDQPNRGFVSHGLSCGKKRVAIAWWHRTALEERTIVRLLRLCEGHFDVKVQPGDGCHILQLGTMSCNMTILDGSLRLFNYSLTANSEACYVPIPKKGRKAMECRRLLLNALAYLTSQKRHEDSLFQWRAALGPLWTERLSVDNEGNGDVTVRLRGVRLEDAHKLVHVFAGSWRDIETDKGGVVELQFFKGNRKG